MYSTNSALIGDKHVVILILSNQIVIELSDDEGGDIIQKPTFTPKGFNKNIIFDCQKLKQFTATQHVSIPLTDDEELVKSQEINKNHEKLYEYLRESIQNPDLERRPIILDGCNIGVE